MKRSRRLIENVNFETSNNEMDSTLNNETSELELMRLENIKRNQDFLSTLGLQHGKSIFEDDGNENNKRILMKGKTTKKKVIEEPVRRSGRVTIDKIKGELEILKTNNASNEEITKKEAELNDLMVKKSENNIITSTIFNNNTNGGYSQSDRLSADPILLSELLHSKQSEDKELESQSRSLVSLLSHINSPLRLSKSTINEKNISEYTKRLNSLSIAEEDVAKLTERRITSVFCHPTHHKLIVAAGDPDGNFGIWDVDSKGNDGLYKYKPHTETLIRIHSYEEEPSKIYTGSYDGTIRYIDLQKQTFVQAFCAPENVRDMSFTDITFPVFSTSQVIVGRSDGHISSFDFRSSNSKYSWNFNLDSSKINSVQVLPSDDNILICASSGIGGYISIFDMRKFSNSKPKPIHTLQNHSKSINAAYSTPDGKYLVSISQDNTIRTWKDFTSPSCSNVITRHDNITGRWLSTFRPCFDMKQPSTFIVGSMEQPRRVQVFGITDNSSMNVSIVKNFQLENLNSVCSRNCVHPTKDIFICGNSSGRVHIIR